MMLKGKAAPLPRVITDLASAGATSDSLTVAFTNSVHATSHERRLDGGAAVAIGEDKTITGLAADTTYTVEVRGVNGRGAGPWSAPLPLTTSTAVVGTLQASRDGLTAVFDEEYVMGEYAGGGDYVVANSNIFTLNSVSISDGITQNTVLGLSVMVDPGLSTRQAFDNRGYAINSYDAALAVTLPLTLNVASGPKTIWMYRGLDTPESGGGGTACYAIWQLTVVPTDPGPTALKPPGVYVAGGKTHKFTTDINYSAIPQAAYPAGVVDRNWNAEVGSGGVLANANFFSRPLANFGSSFVSQAIAPKMYQWPYPAYQGISIGQILLGAQSDIPARTTLINRIVQAGLEVKALVGLGHDIYRTNGGFGLGYRGLMFFAGLLLGDSTMTAKPPKLSTLSTGGVYLEFFAEDGWFWQGDTRILIGIDNNGAVNYTGNHMYREIPPTVYDPHNLPVKSGTAQAADEFSITLAADETGIFAGYPLHLTGGEGAGQIVLVRNWNNTTKVAEIASVIANGVGTAQGGTNNTIQLTASGPTPDIRVSGTFDFVHITGGAGAGQTKRILSWNATTRTATMVSNWVVNPNATSTYEIRKAGQKQLWTTLPNNTTTYDYSTGGTYQTIFQPALMGLAVAVVRAGKVTEWDNDIFFAAQKQWADQNGQLNAPNGYLNLYEIFNVDSLIYYDTAQNYVKKFYQDELSNWPTYP